MNDNISVEVQINILQRELMAIKNDNIILSKQFSFLKEEYINIKRSVWDKIYDQLDKITKIGADTIRQIHEESMSIFESQAFNKKLLDYVERLVSQEIGVKLSQDGLRELIKNHIEQETKDKYQETIQTVSREILNKMSNTFREQARITKDLVYSIDSEIKHLSMRNGLDISTDEIIKSWINKQTNKQFLELKGE
jgi:hypothetical protein